MVVKEINKKYAKIKYSKKAFIEDFFQYLQTGSTVVPIDVINSNIETIDFFYMPILRYQVSASQDVSANIGTEHEEAEEVQTGVVNYTYEKDFFGNHYTKATPETKTVYHTYVTWKKQDFTVNTGEKTFLYCDNKKLLSVLGTTVKSDYGLNFNLNPELSISLKETNPSIKQINEYIKNGDIKKGIFKFIKQNCINDKMIDDAKQAVVKLLNKKTHDTLKSKGDKFENEEFSNIKIQESQTYIYLPVGYIEYKYGNNIYYFVKLLNDDYVMLKTIPEDATFHTKLSDSFRISLIFFFVYVVVMIAAYNIFKSDAIAIFYFVVALLVSDLFAINNCRSKNKEKNIKKRQEYIENLFKENKEKLKNLVIGLNKPFIDL